MKNNISFLITFVVLSSFLTSCSNPMRDRIEKLGEITNELDQKITSIDNIKEIKEIEDKLNVIWYDSIPKIKKEKDYKVNYEKYKKYLEKLIKDYQVVYDRFLLIKEKTEIEFVSKKIKGNYKGDGKTYTNHPTIGSYASGIIFTEIGILENGVVNFTDMTPPNTNWEKFECKLSKLTNITDTLIEGNFTRDGNYICDFIWTKNSLELGSGNWNSSNKKMN